MGRSIDLKYNEKWFAVWSRNTYSGFSKIILRTVREMMNLPIRRELSNAGLCWGVRGRNKERWMHLRTTWNMTSRMMSGFLSLVIRRFEISCTKNHCVVRFLGVGQIVGSKVKKFQNKCFLLDSPSSFEYWSHARTSCWFYGFWSTV